MSNISVILTNKDRNQQSLKIYNLFKDLIDDFIIVDGGKTPLELKCVIKDIGSTVLEAKSQGVSIAKYNWVLVIDSDDEFSKEFVSNLLEFKPVKNTIYIGDTNNIELNLDSVKYKYPFSSVVEYLHKGNFLIEKKNYLKLTKNISTYADSFHVTVNHLINGGNIVVTDKLNYKHNYSSIGSYTKLNRRLFLEDTQQLTNKIINL